MNKSSYYPNYFSIEDIFVTQEKVPCETEQYLHKLGEFKVFVIVIFNV